MEGGGEKRKEKAIQISAEEEGVWMHSFGQIASL